MYCIAGSTLSGGIYPYWYTSILINHGVSGDWKSLNVPGLSSINVGNNAQVNSVSCSSAENCSVGGYYSAEQSNPFGIDLQAFVASEINGKWQDATQVPGVATLNVGEYASVTSMSCFSPGNCSAGGFFTPFDADGTQDRQPFLVNEVDGIWQAATEIRGLIGGPVGRTLVELTVSCAAANACAAGGTYEESHHQLGFLVDEVDGTWQNETEVPGLASLGEDEGSSVQTVSCVSSGDCAAGGDYEDGEGVLHGFLVDDYGDDWQNAFEVPGLNRDEASEVDSVSCVVERYCAAVGDYAVSARETEGFIVGVREWPTSWHRVPELTENPAPRR